MRDLEDEKQKALEGLSKAIGESGESTKPKTREILSDLIALKTDDLVTQAGDPELGAVLFGEYMDSLYTEAWKGFSTTLKLKGLRACPQYQFFTTRHKGSK